MKFNVFSELKYTANSAGTIILNVHALRTPHQSVIEETFNIDPYIKVEELQFAMGENRLMRFEVEPGQAIAVNYNATVDTYWEVKDYTQLVETPVSKMDQSVFPYLYPSRYCQSESCSG